MWAHLAKRTSQRNFKLPSYSPSSSTSSVFSQHSDFPEKILHPQNQSTCPLSGSAQVGVFTSINELGRSNFSLFEDPFGFNSTLKLARGYASVAEAIVSSSDTEEDCSGGANEVKQMVKKEVKGKPLLDRKAKYKDTMLRKRQVKMETEAWEEAAKEYQELLEDICEQKLVPNLPYMKSLFLGWFEPLKSAIVAEQEVCKKSHRKMTHAPYFNDLPADKMAVITMHKLMGLLMTNHNGIGCARVIHAALQIGEAIENEVLYLEH